MLAVDTRTYTECPLTYFGFTIFLSCLYGPGQVTFPLISVDSVHFGSLFFSTQHFVSQPDPLSFACATIFQTASFFSCLPVPCLVACRPIMCACCRFGHFSCLVWLFRGPPNYIFWCFKSVFNSLREK